MARAIHFTFVSRPVATLAVLAISFSILRVASAESPPPPAGDSSKDQVPKPREAGAFEAKFTDRSSLRLTLREEGLELQTPYGNLMVPVAEIRRMDFAARISDETTRRINGAITDLGSQQFKVRETATAELRKLKDVAYPALLRAAKSSDPEVVRRAEELLESIRDTAPEEDLEPRLQDVIHTEHSKLSGRLTCQAIKAHSPQLGELTIKLGDIRGLRLPGTVEEGSSTTASPDPGDLSQFQHAIGQIFRFKVAGRVDGPVWGTDIYTSDSRLATAAVHAGVVKPGRTGVVRVKIVQPPGNFQGSVRHGVNSNPWGFHPGAYQVLR